MNWFDTGREVNGEIRDPEFSHRKSRLCVKASSNWAFSIKKKQTWVFFTLQKERVENSQADMETTISAWLKVLNTQLRTSRVQITSQLCNNFARREMVSVLRGS